MANYVTGFLTAAAATWALRELWLFIRRATWEASPACEHAQAVGVRRADTLVGWWCPECDDAEDWSDLHDL